MYDIEVVRFIKTTSEMPVKDNKCADYICLGHFDMMHIQKLDELTDKPLSIIQHDRESAGESKYGPSENYVYSLYLLKSIPDDREHSLEDFWESTYTYTVVTRIHCDYPTTWDKERIPFSTILEDYCSSQKQPTSRVIFQEPPSDEKTCIVTFSSVVNPDGETKTAVKCLFYDSLELGDTVSIMKSNSLAAILEVIRCISSNTCVRDTYTYSGIRRELIQDMSLEVDPYITANAKLTHVATRFSVRDVQNANAFFCNISRELQSQVAQFYVTGTADRTIQWNIHEEKDLIKIMRILTKYSGDIHWCFNDVITRVGINQEIDPNVTGEINRKEKPNIDMIISDYHVTMQWLRKNIDENHEVNWQYTLLKLLGTLETMYTNYVMDDLANLMIPSVRALIERISYIKQQNDGKMPEKYEDEIIAFLNCWTNLTNDIAQLESQLTQHPELVPVRYYIPAMILQFELRFVAYCCMALSIEKSRNYIPMLIPADTSDLYTLCPLDPRQEDYKLSCPLLVYIPYKDMYRPWETAIRIAHEMAHYCEDPSRERVKRKQILLNCLTKYLTKSWYNEYVRKKLDSKDKYNISNSFARKMKEKFEKSTNLDYPNDPWYLSHTEEVMLQLGTKAVLSDHYLEQYLFSIDSEYFFKHQDDYSIIRKKMRRPEQSLVSLDNFHHYMELLTFLCGECYADIAMIILTDCSFEDYYISVYDDEFKRFLKRCSDPDKLYNSPEVMRQVVRMAIVIRTVVSMDNSTLTWSTDDISQNETIKNRLVDCAVTITNESIAQKSCFLSRYDTNISDFASVDDIDNIYEYLSQCAQTLVKELNSNAERQACVQLARQGISFVKNGGFDWKRIQHYIVS